MGFPIAFPMGKAPCPAGRAGEVTSNGAILQHEAINDQRRAGPGQCGDGYLGEPVFECAMVVRKKTKGNFSRGIEVKLIVEYKQAWEDFKGGDSNRNLS